MPAKANKALAHIFDEMSAILELTGANPFRVNSYARAARVLEDLPTDVSDIADHKQLVAIEGIGDGTAKKILQYLETGHVKDHDALLEEVPRGLLDVLKIPGLGPKTVKMMWDKVGITDVESLKAKLDTGELEKLPRLGPKAVENIRKALAFVARTDQRRRLGQALPVAEAIVAHLRRVPGSARVEYAGSLRRGRETIGDIDILAATSDPSTLAAAFRAMPGVEQVLVAGDTKSSVRIEAGMQVDLRVVDEVEFGAALLYFTGSKDHNVILRERAIKQKLRLNEYGLFPVDQEGAPPVAAADEQGIYAALGLPWIPPELREDRGELSLTETPRLIELADIRCELHAHTVASDGRMSIDELVALMLERRYHTIAITDHSKSSGSGLKEDELEVHLAAIRAANERFDGIEILAGSEVDIRTDGSLDYDDEVLAQLDIVIASPHTSLHQDPDVATQRLLKAIEHPLVHIIGHPTGRVVNRREGLQPDIPTLVAAAAEHDTALEINANSVRLDLRDTHVKAAMDAGALIAINCDVHRPEHLDELPFGVLTGRRGWLTAERCINTWTRKKLMGWIKKK